MIEGMRRRICDQNRTAFGIIERSSANHSERGENVLVRQCTCWKWGEGRLNAVNWTISMHQSQDISVKLDAHSFVVIRCGVSKIIVTACISHSLEERLFRCRLTSGWHSSTISCSRENVSSSFYSSARHACVPWRSKIWITINSRSISEKKREKKVNFIAFHSLILWILWKDLDASS